MTAGQMIDFDQNRVCRACLATNIRIDAGTSPDGSGKLTCTCQTCGNFWHERFPSNMQYEAAKQRGLE